MKTIVTSFNSKLYDKYAFRLIESYEKFNISCPLLIYTEDENFDPYLKQKHHVINLHDVVPESKEFLIRNKNRKRKDESKLNTIPYHYKAYSQCHASTVCKGKMFWVDSDCVFRQPIPDSWWDKILGDAFISYYNRSPLPTETGFMGYNLEKQCSAEFFKIFRSYYDTDKVYDLDGYTDMETLDDTMLNMINYKDYSEKKLGSFKTHGVLHVMARDMEMAPYIDHCKGKRKIEGKSPELIV